MDGVRVRDEGVIEKMWEVDMRWTFDIELYARSQHLSMRLVRCSRSRRVFQSSRDQLESESSIRVEGANGLVDGLHSSRVGSGCATSHRNLSESLPMISQ